VRLLLDSHTFIWWATGSSSLGVGARDLIADPGSAMAISTAALWELTIKCASGKLVLPDALEDMVLGEGLSILPIEFDHLRRLETLPRHHRDPFDRMMIAQALTEGIPVATRDRIFSAYGVQVVW
jgi:PIN domain nuclease of toxin-antitoxin system